MEISKPLFTEALSAILGVTVKFQSDCKHSDGVIQLDITSLTTIALLGLEALSLADQPVSYLTSLLTRLFVGEQKKENTSASLRDAVFAIPDDFFDPKFDFDFTDMRESGSDPACTRGDEPYKRPYGWMRFALKVRDKYPDGNGWLGPDGWRSRSEPGEWPVSYHGTGLKGAEGIVQTHFRAGGGQAYGRGVYSSPDINMAEMYAEVGKFKSQKNGKTYRVIMQNRVNPKKREIVDKDIWLVPIPEGTSAAKEKEIVESSIRPYGLLLKEV
ncbi:uncharacterized protein LOC122323292 [Puntigrus tetrazona]|uniref:uncharacterized protein LOC122323292 n=1 Tax=Puntigrus tetrazona TaxID=1606681 RepID=UPI001C8AA5CA|nr:uncharacterized protein LOC122323292 [Puntigrus tetrazona]